MRSMLAFLVTILAPFVVHASDIALVTLTTDYPYEDLLADALENKKKYCEQQGYDFICVKKMPDLNLPISLNKILVIQQVMKENPSCKWVFWCDPASLIVNQQVPLEFFTDEASNLIVADYLSKEHVTDVIPKADQFLVKNCEWSQNFLSLTFTTQSQWRKRRKKGVISNDEWRSPIGFVPARLFNSLPTSPDVDQPNETQYFQTGDFLVSFANLAHIEGFPQLFEAYKQKVTDCSTGLSFETLPTLFKNTLLANGSNLSLQSGDAQLKQFEAMFQQNPSIRSVAKVGSNDNTNASYFFLANEHLEQFFYFSSKTPSIIPGMANYFAPGFKDRYQFVKGDLEITIPKHAASRPEQKADLIFIDSLGPYGNCLSDIYYARELSHSKTKLWINNSHLSPVKNAIKHYVEHGIIEVLAVHESNGESEPQSWTEARYCTPHLNN